MSEYDAADTWSRGEVWAGGRHLATYHDYNWPDAALYFSSPDGLGSERLRTRTDGSLAETCTALPFGDGLNCSFPNGAATDSPLHFTGKPRDAETGLDYFGFRYNSSTLGRWMTPDPAGNLVASPANPQSWNQYAYVLNNPATLVDPFGLFGTDPALCSTSAGMAYCPGTSVTVNGGDGAIIDTVPIPVPLGAVIGTVGTGSAPSRGGGGSVSTSVGQITRECVQQF